MIQSNHVLYRYLSNRMTRIRLCNDYVLGDGTLLVTIMIAISKYMHDILLP